MYSSNMQFFQYVIEKPDFWSPDFFLKSVFWYTPSFVEVPAKKSREKVWKKVVYVLCVYLSINFKSPKNSLDFEFEF